MLSRSRFRRRRRHSVSRFGRGRGLPRRSATRSYRIAAPGAHAEYTVRIDPAAAAPDVRIQLAGEPGRRRLRPGRRRRGVAGCHGAAIRSVKIDAAARRPTWWSALSADPARRRLPHLCALARVRAGERRRAAGDRASAGRRRGPRGQSFELSAGVNRAVSLHAADSRQILLVRQRIRKAVRSKIGATKVRRRWLRWSPLR